MCKYIRAQTILEQALNEESKMIGNPAMGDQLDTSDFHINGD